MDIKEATENLKQKEVELANAFKQLEETKVFLMKKMAPKEQKESTVDGEQIKAAVTESGTVMIQFVSFEEAKKYFDKL